MVRLTHRADERARSAFDESVAVLRHEAYLAPRFRQDNQFSFLKTYLVASSKMSIVGLRRSARAMIKR